MRLNQDGISTTLKYLVCLPTRLQIALNKNIVQLWLFWDQRPMFTSWTGVARKFYMSAAATCAGWVSVPASLLQSVVAPPGLLSVTCSIVSGNNPLLIARHPLGCRSGAKPPASLPTTVCLSACLTCRS